VQKKWCSLWLSWGAPAYLNKFDENLSFIDNVNENILQRATFLYDEAAFLLKEELRTLTNYELILEAISKGKNRISEISKETGIPVSRISPSICVSS